MIQKTVKGSQGVGESSISFPGFSAVHTFSSGPAGKIHRQQITISVKTLSSGCIKQSERHAEISHCNVNSGIKKQEEELQGKTQMPGVTSHLSGLDRGILLFFFSPETGTFSWFSGLAIIPSPPTSIISHDGRQSHYGWSTAWSIVRKNCCISLCPPQLIFLHQLHQNHKMSLHFLLPLSLTVHFYNTNIYHSRVNIL